jgi:hypothetical protein
MICTTRCAQVHEGRALNYEAHNLARDDISYDVGVGVAYCNLLRCNRVVPR